MRPFIRLTVCTLLATVMTLGAVSTVAAAGAPKTQLMKMSVTRTITVVK